jgi:hypothetical protein
MKISQKKAKIETSAGARHAHQVCAAAIVHLPHRCPGEITEM